MMSVSNTTRFQWVNEYFTFRIPEELSEKGEEVQYDDSTTGVEPLQLAQHVSLVYVSLVLGP
jgi:hypothetical protein